MSDTLYERYKDALRRGHVATLRGRLDAALAAYGEAAEIAPERSLPHASLGRVLQLLGRPDEALGSFGVALERAPNDETALAGRAEVLAAQGSRTEAADTLDRLAEAQERAGRVSDACDTARRALELAESRPRRRLVERLARRLREAPADDAAAAVLERAMGILEPPAAPDAALAQAAAALDQPVAAAPPPTGSQLVAEAEDLLQAGDEAEARQRLLAGAATHRAAGHIDAALDACYLALGVAPAEPALHLTLAELYLERGWRGPAAEKLLLLGRLVELGDDGDTRRRICEIAADRLADDARLSAYCA
jgi:tetratricopeptide (TPR) repeat protein